MKKRLAQGCLLAFGLGLLLLHTQPIERLIFRQIRSQLAGLGWHCDAKRFDLNLFRLSARFEDFEISGPGAQAALKTLDLNGSAGLLLGRLSMDRVFASAGHVHIQPVPSPQTNPSPKPLELPKVTLGSARFEQVQLRFQDQKQLLNFGAQNIAIAYENEQLDASMTTAATTIQGRAIPKIDTELRLRTSTFQSFEDIQLQLKTDQSFISSQGTVGQNFIPNLRFQADLGSDLLPENPGIKLSGSVDEQDLHLEASNSLPIGSKPKAWTMTAQLPYRATHADGSVQISVEDLLAGDIHLKRQGQDISGEFDINGIPKGIHELQASLAIQTATLKGSFQMPKLDPQQLQGAGVFQMRGRPQADVALNYEQQILTLNGTVQPAKGASIALQATLDKALELRFQGDADQLSSFKDYLQLPKDLGTGPIRFEGGLTSADFRDFTLEPTQIQISRARVSNYFEDDLLLHAQGPLSGIRGTLNSVKLNPNQHALEFQLDALESQWQQLLLAVNTSELPLEPFTYKLVIQAEGSGPLVAPELKGGFTTALNKAMQPAGSLTGSFKHQNHQLELSNITGITRHGNLEGLFVLDTQKLQWRTNLEIKGRQHDEWQPLTEFPTPEFTLTLAGSQAQLQGQLSLPQQILPLDSFEIPIQNNAQMTVAGTPQPSQVKAQMGLLQVAGVQVSQLQADLDGDQVRFQSQFSLIDAPVLKSVLASLWPEDLELQAVSGHVQAVTDTTFKTPTVQITLQELEGQFRGEPLKMEALQAQWEHQRLVIEPNQFQFAGTDISISTPDISDANPALPLNFRLAFDLKDASKLEKLVGPQWPTGFSMDTLKGSVQLHSDWLLKDPQVDLELQQFEALYNGQMLQTSDLKLGYHQGVRVSPGEIQMGDLAVQLLQLDNGIAIKAKPDMLFLSNLVPDLVGDATFDAEVFWSQKDTNFSAKISQTGGRLIYPEPWIEVESLVLNIAETEAGVYEVTAGHAKANGRDLSYGGTVDLRGEEPEITIFGDVNQLHLAFADYQFSLNAVVEWQKGKSINQLQGTVAIRDGYFSPDIEVEGLVQELLSPVPSISFPDPMLEDIRLQINVLTENPIVVEHELGYWELETPALIISGNLANPIPLSGSVNIEEGSILRQGRNTYLFQNSQVQFHPNRVNDPYLQIVMVDAANKEEKQPIYFTGYISEIDKNLSSQDITSFLLKFLLGRVTSLVSFEIQISDSLTESSFTTWVSRRLTDKVVVRYAIPLNDQDPLLEVKMGPFWRNFLNLSEKDNTYRTAVRHAQRFGFREKPPETVKKVIFQSKELPKHLRRKFKLEKGDIYSDTRIHYAIFDLERRLKREGYLDPQIEWQYEERIFRIQAEPGPKFTLAIEGLEISEEEKQQLFLEMQNQGKSANRHLELLMEKLALSKGHPSAAAFAEVKDHQISIQVYVGHAIGDVSLNFGNAQELLGELYQDKKEARRFVIKYFLSPGSGESELRGRLAAKGYVLPEIEPAQFPTPETCQIDIEPGPRAHVFAVIINGGEQYPSEFLGLPFEYDYLAKTVTTLGEPVGKQRFQVRLTPRRIDQDILFDVVKTEVIDQTIDQLNVDGAGRISQDKIRAFLGFKKAMTQSKLMKNQERLVETGTFTLARFRHASNVALLEVKERNRWDMDYELSYDDVNQLGFGVQFRDRMMFKGFNPLGIRVQRDRVQEEFIVRQQFLRVFGTPLDLFVGLGWNNQRLDLKPAQSEPFFGTVFVTRRPREQSDINAGVSYRLSENQLLTLGITYQDIRTRQFEEVFFLDENNQLVPDPTIPPARLADFKVNRVPITTSWLYSNLDNELYPNKGIFSQVSYEYFPEGLGTDSFLSGWRGLAKFNSFFTFGRWRWWQRYEAGLYQREFSFIGPIEDDSDENLFFLGGPKSIRGFGYQLIGSLQENAEGNLVTNGGRAMAVWTQELNFDLKLYGLGLSPFVDGGWVWENREDFLKDGMVITGGIGLTLETPIGRFRLDWAKPLDEGPFNRTLNKLYMNNPELRDRGRNQVLDEFSIRFGRVF